MKFRAEHSAFAEAISWANRTVGARPRLPSLAGILLEADDGRLTSRASDLEVAAEVTVPVRVDEPGRALLHGKLLAHLVTRLAEEPVEVEGGADRVTIRCGRASFEVRGLPPDDFQSLPDPDSTMPAGVAKAESFARLVGQVARAASTEEARPVLTGVKLEATETALTGVATDSYRLAVRRLAWDRGVSAEALVPARALSEAAKAASETGGEVRMVFEDGQASFLFGDRRLTTRLIEGNYPSYGQLIPDEHDTRVIVERDGLVQALQRVAVVALGQPNTPVTLTFAEGGVDLAAGNQEVGDATESLPAQLEGAPVTIAFNPSFLLAGLEAAGTDLVVIDLREGLKPAVVRPHGDQADDFVYVLMPVRTD